MSVCSLNGIGQATVVGTNNNLRIFLSSLSLFYTSRPRRKRRKKNTTIATVREVTGQKEKSKRKGKRKRKGQNGGDHNGGDPKVRKKKKKKKAVLRRSMRKRSDLSKCDYPCCYRSGEATRLCSFAECDEWEVVACDLQHFHEQCSKNWNVKYATGNRKKNIGVDPICYTCLVQNYPELQ